MVLQNNSHLLKDRPSYPGIYSDFADGSMAKEHPVLKDNSTAL